MAILSNGKTLELGAGCLISETFLYLSGVIQLIGRCLTGEVFIFTFTFTGTLQIAHFQVANLRQLLIVTFTNLGRTTHHPHLVKPTTVKFSTVGIYKFKAGILF